jgi:hypothetical protein
LIPLLTPVESRKKFKRILHQVQKGPEPDPGLKEVVKPPILRPKLCTIPTLRIKSETSNKEPKIKNNSSSSKESTKPKKSRKKWPLMTPSSIPLRPGSS